MGVYPGVYRGGMVQGGVYPPGYREEHIQGGIYHPRYTLGYTHLYHPRYTLGIPIHHPGMREVHLPIHHPGMREVSLLYTTRVYGRGTPCYTPPGYVRETMRRIEPPFLPC